MGENGAGKSTLLKCLFGMYEKDQGKIFFKGQEINFTSSKEALENGVSMVHQELNQVLYRSVMENMWLGRFPLKGGLVDHKKMYNDTKAVLDDLEIKELQNQGANVRKTSAELTASDRLDLYTALSKVSEKVC